MTKRLGFALLTRSCAVGVVKAAREQGKSQVALRVGDLRQAIRLLLPAAGIPVSRNDAYDICQELDTDIFRSQARVKLISTDGPTKAGIDTVYRFQVVNSSP